MQVGLNKPFGELLIQQKQSHSRTLTAGNYNLNFQNTGLSANGSIFRADSYGNIKTTGKYNKFQFSSARAYGTPHVQQQQASNSTNSTWDAVMGGINAGLDLGDKIISVADKGGWGSSILSLFSGGSDDDKIAKLDGKLEKAKTTRRLDKILEKAQNIEQTITQKKPEQAQKVQEAETVKNEKDKVANEAKEKVSILENTELPPLNNAYEAAKANTVEAQNARNTAEETDREAGESLEIAQEELGSAELDLEAAKEELATAEASGDEAAIAAAQAKVSLAEITKAEAEIKLEEAEVHKAQTEADLALKEQELASAKEAEAEAKEKVDAKNEEIKQAKQEQAKADKEAEDAKAKYDKENDTLKNMDQNIQKLTELKGKIGTKRAELSAKGGNNVKSEKEKEEGNEIQTDLGDEV